MNSDKSVIETIKALAEPGSTRAKVKDNSESTRRLVKANFREKDEFVGLTYARSQRGEEGVCEEQMDK